MKRIVLAAFAAASAVVAGCSQQAESNEQFDGNGVSIRNLTESDVAASLRNRDFKIDGTLIPTPSDRRSQHYLLRARTAVTGKTVAILREERANKVAYVRAEVDCRRRLFHVVGVAPSRAEAEVAVANDGPLRPMTGLPLRQELGAFICERVGTPLTPA